MSSFAATGIDPPMMMRVNATPALTRISSSALLQMVIPETETAPVNAPLEGLHSGSLFLDRTDANLLWYAPVYSIAADPDPAFAFSAIQTGHDEKGNPFFAGRLTLSIAKSIPSDVPGFKARFPNARVQEIPVDRLTASLTTSYKDASGNDQFRTLEGVVAAGSDGNLKLTFDNILAGAVVSLYEDLVMFGGASVVLSGTYTLWRQILHPVPVGPPRPRIPIDPVPRPVFAPTSGRTVIVHPRIAATRFRPLPTEDNQEAAAPIMMTFRPAVLSDATRMSAAAIPIDQPNIPEPDYQRIATPLLFKFDLAKKYATNPYSLQFTVNDGTSTRPIINVEDLREFNVRQSEFKQLTALGDISQRYASLNQAYIGVLSKTVVVIPARYVIARSAATLDCGCLALVDSASSGASKCKFQFSLLIAPDVSSIDLLQFSQEISSNASLQGYTVKLPDFLKEGTTPKLQTAFESSVDCAKTSVSHAFSLAIQVRDDDNGSPAIANANILIRQLCADQEPFLSGSIAVKLDDFYPDPVEATVILNFHKSVGDAAELSFALDEATQAVDVVNRSSFNLRFSRYALCNAGGINVTAVDQQVQSGGTFQAPLPADHNALTILVDRETAFTGPIAKSDMGPLMKFQTQDVQNTQYMIGVNATSVNFEGRGISQIAVSVSLTDLPDVSVSTFALVKMRKLNQANVVIPIQFAVSHLNATLKFTVHHTDPQQADSAFTLQHEFIEEPILILIDSDLNNALAG